MHSRKLRERAFSAKQGQVIQCYVGYHSNKNIYIIEIPAIKKTQKNPEVLYNYKAVPVTKSRNSSYIGKNKF